MLTKDLSYLPYGSRFGINVCFNRATVIMVKSKKAESDHFPILYLEAGHTLASSYTYRGKKVSALLAPSYEPRTRGVTCSGSGEPPVAKPQAVVASRGLA